MRIYPNSYSGNFQVGNGKKFLRELGKTVEPTTGEPIPTCEFIGKIFEDRFKIRKKFSYGNSFRPEIVGKLKDGDLKLSIGISRSLIIMITVTYVLIGFTFRNFIFPPLVLTTILWTMLWYLSGWMFYRKEYRITKNAIIEVIENYCPE